VTQSDKLNPGDFPTRKWPVDRYVRDRHTLTLPSDLAAGDYQLTVGLPFGAPEDNLRLQPQEVATEWFVLRTYSIDR
jgi:hypothetical protein